MRSDACDDDRGTCTAESFQINLKVKDISHNMDDDDGVGRDS